MQTRLSYRTFFSFFLAALVLFLAYHLAVWYLLSAKIFNASPYYIGDLGRMSYQIGSLYPRIALSELSSKHLDGKNWDGKRVDLITLGDSFSNGMGSGKNPYYQDFLATKYQIRVLNIQNIDPSFGYIDTLRTLHKQGWLARVAPKAILIECIVRESLDHIPSKHQERIFSSKELSRALFKNNFTTEFPKTMFINTANYKAPYYYFKYRYSVHAKKEIYKFPLNRPLFSVKESNQLLVYHDDLRKIDGFTQESVSALNRELNSLADELKKDNITLIFMPAVDKYDLYYEYLHNKEHSPKNPFFDLLRREPKHYQLIDTKEILAPLLERGVSDLYYADDTHWSFKASEEIAKNDLFTFLIKSKDNNNADLSR